MPRQKPPKIPSAVLARARSLAVLARAPEEAPPEPPPPPRPTRPKLARDKVVAALKRLHPMD